MVVSDWFPMRSSGVIVIGFFSLFLSLLRLLSLIHSSALEKEGARYLSTIGIFNYRLNVRDWHLINLTLIYATTWDARLVVRVRVTAALRHALRHCFRGYNI